VAASQETSAAALAASVHLLATHPAALDAVRRTGRWREAADEALRLESPVQMTMRSVEESVTVGGSALASGDHVLAVLASANRDDTTFADPDRFDPERDPATHVAFGAGPHACPGAAIAHLELEVALAALFQRFGAITIEADPRWETSLTLRSMRSLVVRLEE
jgi:cytochrome P450